LTAWVLIYFGLGGYAIPGIASEAACLELRERLTFIDSAAIKARCVEYQAVVPIIVGPRK
jgi:hypothetical protein